MWIKRCFFFLLWFTVITHPALRIKGPCLHLRCRNTVLTWQNNFAVVSNLDVLRWGYYWELSRGPLETRSPEAHRGHRAGEADMQDTETQRTEKWKGETHKSITCRHAPHGHEKKKNYASWMFWTQNSWDNSLITGLLIYTASKQQTCLLSRLRQQVVHSFCSIIKLTHSRRKKNVSEFFGNSKTKLHHLFKKSLLDSLLLISYFFEYLQIFSQISTYLLGHSLFFNFFEI